CTSESDTGTTLWGRFTSESDTEPLNQVSDSEGVRHRLLCTRTPKVSDTACCVYRAAQAAAGTVHAIYTRQTTTVCAMPGCWSTISPRRLTVSPCAVKVAAIASAWSAATTITMPMPQLKTRCISVSATLPCCCSHWNS